MFVSVGKRCLGKKSDLINIHKRHVQQEDVSETHTKISDWPAFSSFWKIKAIEVFDSAPSYFRKQLQCCKRIGIVWQTYISEIIYEKLYWWRGQASKAAMFQTNRDVCSWKKIKLNSSLALLLHSSELVAEGKQVITSDDKDIIPSLCIVMLTLFFWKH